MKKIISFLVVAVFGLLSYNCTSDDNSVNVDYDTYPVVYDLKNVSFTNENGSFEIFKSFTNPLYDSDMMLVYMQVGTTNNNAPIWQQIPITLYLNDGNEVDYNFDFSKYDFVIYAGGTFDLTNTTYVTNKTFRIVLIPASFGKSNQVDFSDYQSVIDYFHIDDSNPANL